MTPSFTPNDLFTISPMLSVMVLGMIVLMVDLALPRDRKSPVVAMLWSACSCLSCSV